MGESGERRINWDFDRTTKGPRVLQKKEIGTADAPKLMWELQSRRELEDGAGLEHKAAGLRSLHKEMPLEFPQRQS